jgi:hypothetical protein
MTLVIRAEFFNIFNRVRLIYPESGYAMATQRRTTAGVPQSGFGRIDGTNQGNLPRSGQIALRLRF